MLDVDSLIDFTERVLFACWLAKLLASEESAEAA
jgi:hypothetical protein